MSKDYAEYVQINRDNILHDIGRLIAIRSVRGESEPGAPYGRSIREVQDLAMQMCVDYGFDEVVNVDDRIAYAHYGDRKDFISIVAHLDVVPEGSGWSSDPFQLTIRDGYIVGRGVGDDKGPFVLGLWAIKYIIDHKIPLRYGIRLIIGLDEECGMSDIKYYAERCPTALFTFTPDAGFPVCHGEKGLFGCDILSDKIEAGVLKRLEGGVAHNVVPDYCLAELSVAHADALQKAAQGRDDIQVNVLSEIVRVQAKGISAHASLPQDSVNAALVMLRFLLEADVLSAREKEYASFLCTCLEKTDGSQYGIAREDGIFTPLTIIGGLIALLGDRLVLNVDSRYPSNITGEEIARNIALYCESHTFQVANVDIAPPFYIKPDSPAIQLLCDTYNRYAGTDEKPFVISGGTYARYLPNAVSYGIERNDMHDPDWVGTAHMKDEAINIDLAMMSCEIFIDTLLGLQQISLN